MHRFAPYLGVIAALALALGVSLVAKPEHAAAPRPEPGRISIVPSAPSSLFAPFTTAVTGGLLATSSPEAASSTPAASQPEEAPPTPVLPPAPAPEPVSAPAATSTAVAAPAPAPLPSSGDGSLDASATALRSALVNILCYAPAGSTIHSISGSGVFVDSKGIILTNAHIAQYFLLRDRSVSCTIRMGSPARDAYRAALIYIPADWVQKNAAVITEAAPSGTGEGDFAFLAVTESVPSGPPPASFPSVSLAETPPQKGTPVVIASYGAQFLATSQVQTALYPTIVFGAVKDIFTFTKNTIDVLSLGGSAAAQEGSSGGGVATAAGKLVGTITTSTIEGATDTRTLNAITASYVRAAYASETGEALDLLLSRPTTTSVESFALQIPTLEAFITANL